MRIETGTMAQIFEQADGLLREHWEETARNKTLMHLQPDRVKYYALEANGDLFTLIGFDASGTVAGYSINFIGQHLHYQKLRVASNDVLFVHRDLRKGATGLRLMRATEAAARARGAQMMLWHAKPQTSLDSLLPLLGYGVQDMMYSKEL